MITAIPGSYETGNEPSEHGLASAALTGTPPVGSLRRASLVVLPTYNERDNLESIVVTVLERGHDVLIVDDNSPDGTGALADRLSASLVGVRVLHRAQKLGLGSAYREGFQVGLEQEYEFILEMDADGSHLADDLHRLIEAARVSNGLAIGSRYIAGGTIIGCSAERRILSKAANVYCRLLLRHRLFDWTSGYRCYTSRALKEIGLNTIQSTGFDFQIEAAFRCLEHGVAVTEVPIRFQEREVGQSKASAAEIRMGLLRVAKLRRARSLSRRQRLNLERMTSVGKPPTVPVQKPIGAGIDGHPLQSVVVGVLAHNEEATVETCLRAILAEHDGVHGVKSVLVVASGCTDHTEDIVRRVATEDVRVHVVVEPERTGKAAAINLLLRESEEPIVVVTGGDVVFTSGSVLRLVAPFVDPTVGMTGARPIPTNRRAGIVGSVVHILWGLHHELSLTRPKLGEAVAFRRVVETIDRNTLVDEAMLERLIKSMDLQLKYVPEAIVRNHGPETIHDYLAQRVRVYTGHLNLAANSGYRVSSMSMAASAGATWRLWRKSQSLRYLMATLALEAIARTLARIISLSGRRQTNGLWDPIPSSKRVVANGHMLRSHHERKMHLRVRPTSAPIIRNRRACQVVIARVGTLIRADDDVRQDNGHVLITIRSDETGALAVCARLRQQMPQFEHVILGDAPHSVELSNVDNADLLEAPLP